MHSTILAVAAGTSLAFAGIGAQAMPAGQLGGTGATPHVTLAAEGCGPGFARGPAGGCRPIARGPVVVVPGRPVVVPARPVVVVPARPVVVAPRRAGCGVRVGPVGVRTPC